MTVYDFYSECEDAFKAYMLELSEFFTEEWHVSSNDTNITRGGDNFIVYRPGAFPTVDEFQTGLIKDIDWEIVFDLYVKYAEREESWAIFRKIRASLFWHLNCNPILRCNVEPEKSAKNVYKVNLSSDESAQYFRFDDVGEEQVPNFIIQSMTVTIRQRVEFEF